jgi:Zn-dependent protease
MMDLVGVVQQVSVVALPLVFAITLHEAAHGFAAYALGDDTAKRLGRISLNPLRHIDPFGTIILPAMLMLMGSFLFGWAKPVPVDFSKLRKPKRDMIWVAAAGPASNLVMAIGWVFLYKFAPDLPAAYVMPAQYMAQAGIMINVVLMVLNLLPLPPLDGGRIAVGLLPNHLAFQFAKLEQYGFIILIVLLVTGVLSKIMTPFISLTISLISWLFV